MKIVILDGHSVNPGDLSFGQFEQFGDLTVYKRTAPHEVIERVRGAQIVLTNKSRMSRDAFEAAPGIKWVGVLATGYDVVDIDAAREKGIPVCNVADYATAGVSEMVFALLLELCRHVGQHSEAVKKGQWAASHDFCFWNHQQTEICGKTLGLIGLGNIGCRTAQIAQAFGMKVLAVSGSRRLKETDTLRYVSQDELFARSDVISLHCPLTEQTRGMIDKNAIEQMKDGVLFINTARGALVDEQVLFDALESGKVGGAACDVVSKEPIRTDNPLLRAKNMIITPHIAWASKESRQRLIDRAAANLAAFLDGRTECAVNMD